MSITLTLLGLYERYGRPTASADAPGLDEAELIVTLTPALAQLETLRQSTVETIERS